MNIVVIGSCTDSSNLAKELNKRLQTSIVARIDMLKNIKQLLLQDMNVNTNENLGTYIGDVETFNYSALTETKKREISVALQSIAVNLEVVKKDNRGESNTVSTFDALTNGIPTGTYSFIKIYSGAVDDRSVNKLTRQSSDFLPNSIFVVVKNPRDALLPISVSESILTYTKKNAFAFIECEQIEDVFKSELFQLLFKLGNEQQKEAETTTVTEVTRVGTVETVAMAA